MFLVPGTGEELPNQRKPDGTPKANDDPTRNNPTNPNAPPPVVYSAPIPRYSFLGEGVPAAIESANSGSCLSFDAFCTVFIPELAGAGMWLHPAEDPALCVTARLGSVYLDPCIETAISDSQLWIDRPEDDGIAFTLRSRANFASCLKTDTSFGTCTDPTAQWVGTPGGDTTGVPSAIPNSVAATSSAPTNKLAPPPGYVPLATSDGKCVVLLPGKTKNYFSGSKNRHLVIPPLILCADDDQAAKPAPNSKLNSASDSNCKAAAVGGLDPMIGIRSDFSALVSGPGGFSSTQSIACQRKGPVGSLGTRITVRRDQAIDWLRGLGAASAALRTFMERYDAVQQRIIALREGIVSNVILLQRNQTTLAQLRTAIADQNFARFQQVMGKIMESNADDELAVIFGRNNVVYVASTNPTSAFDYRLAVGNSVLRLDLTGGSLWSYVTHINRAEIDVVIQYASFTYADFIRVASMNL